MSTIQLNDPRNPTMDFQTSVKKVCHAAFHPSAGSESFPFASILYILPYYRIIAMGLPRMKENFQIWPPLLFRAVLGETAAEQGGSRRLLCEKIPKNAKFFGIFSDNL